MKDEIREIENLFKLADQHAQDLKSPYQKKHILTDDDSALIADIIALLSQSISYNLAKDAFNDTISEVSAQVLFMTGEQRDSFT